MDYPTIEKEEGEERGNGELVRQQEHDHKLDLAIADLYSDVGVEFFDPRMLQ
jgi:hypothetical protein